MGKTKEREGMWWDEGWQLVSGCSPVSDACDNCWAIAMDKRFRGSTEVEIHPERLGKPLKRTKPKKFAIWNDLFHKDVPDEFIGKVFDTIRKVSWHTYPILTKRTDRMARVVTELIEAYGIEYFEHCWFGTTCENQRTADERIPTLLQIPAAVRFLSCEPLLSGIDIIKAMPVEWWQGKEQSRKAGIKGGISWIVIGCESLGKKAGRFQDGFIDAAIDIVRQCLDAGVAPYVKQIPIDGYVCKDITKFPKELQYREYPK